LSGANLEKDERKSGDKRADEKPGAHVEMIPFPIGPEGQGM
jgi:hypothetical protein